VIHMVRPVPAKKLRSKSGSRRARMEPTWAVAISSRRSAQQRPESALFHIVQRPGSAGALEERLLEWFLCMSSLKERGRSMGLVK
jgi:hypothetical protein